MCPKDWLEKLHAGDMLPEKDAKALCSRVVDILSEENNVVNVSSPVTVCGDIHGQLHDLIKLLEVGGAMPSSKYVFMGDFVDRGHHSVETMQLLMTLKVLWPDSIVLTRGNHEGRQITQAYGFYDECAKKYGNANVWKYCVQVFDHLPLAAVIDGRIMCVHGGLSPEIQTIDSIRAIDRCREPPQEGAFADLMWSDPDESIDYWQVNPRGAGFLFGEMVAAQFNHVNSLDLLCRAHQLVMEGYRYSFSSKSLVTVWSAPNYCYRSGNVAAILSLDSKLQREFKIFRESTQSAKIGAAAAPMSYFL